MNAKYNGWTNYNTWVIAMFLDGNYGDYDDKIYYREMALEYYDIAAEDRGAYELSKAIEESLEELASEITETAGIFADLLTHAMGWVDWYQLAENILLDIEEEAHRSEAS